MCSLRLTSRTGPYRIIASKTTAGVPSDVPRIRVRIVNNSSRPILVGGPSGLVQLNFVTPQARGHEPVRVNGSARPQRVAPRSSVTFTATSPLRVVQRGRYEFNVSYGGVDSNIVTYTVR